MDERRLFGSGRLSGHYGIYVFFGGGGGGRGWGSYPFNIPIIMIPVIPKSAMNF